MFGVLEAAEITRRLKVQDLAGLWPRFTPD